MARRKKLLYAFLPRIAYTSAKGVQWYEVTWYSKLLTIIFCFGIFPALAFYIGTQYQQTKDVIESTVTIQYGQ
jgi:hypothetical protein